MPTTNNNDDDTYTPDIPENWEAGGGNRSDTHYTRDFYLVNDDGYVTAEIRAYWDDGESHSVRLDSVRRIDERGDIVDTTQRAYMTYDSEREAMKQVERLMETYDLERIEKVAYDVEITVKLEKKEVETRYSSKIDRDRVLDELVHSEDFEIDVDMP